MVTSAPAPPTSAAPAGPPGRPRHWGPSDWRLLAWRPAAVGLLLAVSVAGAAISYDGVLRGWAWLYPIVVVVFATGVAIAVARLLRAPHVVPSIVGLVVWALTMCFMFLRDTTLLGFIPTAQTLEGAREALDEAWNTISFEAVPASPNVGIVALLAGALGLTALIGEAIGVSCRMPAIAGVAPLSVLTVPALLKSDGPGGWGFAVGGAAYLAALALARAEVVSSEWGSGPSSRPPRAAGAAVSPSRVITLVAAVVVGALVLPALIPGFDSGSFPEGSRLKYFGQNVGLNPFISLGNDLRSAQGVGIIRYATDSTQPVYLQTTTVDSFEGSTWGPDNRDDARQYDLSAISTETAQTAPLVTTTTVISTGNFTSPYLPVPYAPVSITGVQGRMGWDPLSLSIKGDPGASLGQNYVVRSVAPNLTPAELAAVSTAPRGIGLETSAVPSNVPGLVRTTAETITKGATTPYAKALAIQAYLRTFTYSEQAPVQQGYDGTGMDVLEKFLEKKSGYCIHFAAAMAVMARLVGIPSRIAVGFAPGHPTGASVAVAGLGSLPEYQVDARDAHAWPQLYFQGLGWVPFEPTPSRGAVPSYAQTDTPAGTSTNLDNPNDAVRPAPAPKAATPTPTATPSHATGRPSAAATGTEIAGLALGAALLAGLLILPAAIRATQRRKRLARGVEGIWEELEALGLDHGLPADPADTPRTYARRLERWEADDGGSPGHSVPQPSSVPEPSGVPESSVQAASVQAGSVQAGSVQAASVQAGSVQAGSVQAGSVQAGSVQAGSVQAGSVQAGSVQAGSVQAGSVQAGSSQASTPLRGALATLTREYERHEYGRPGYKPDDAAAREALATVARAGRASRSPLARARIAALPPSAFARTSHRTRRALQTRRLLQRSVEGAARAARGGLAKLLKRR
ncbi:transglutaminaseTgpA domain-containing protein [Sinomonas sp. 5-5]|uniref:TransglutaminaseTgpA domain-containing protein n=1 Tax=Sinomonas terrae TaxID=2908838 RepID=A0ABS9U333_9MICC|nr:transglutaminaseTgpA domain-containing protein [Sinomonas terrae]MCH6471108.1 transglutaminaseTgpA domain-containing protein [Sinomonas terrae]